MMMMMTSPATIYMLRCFYLSCTELRAEIEKLRVQTGDVSDDVITSSLLEISSLKQKLSEREREMAEITRLGQTYLCLLSTPYFFFLPSIILK